MTAVWVLVRVRRRARWPALLGLALPVGVASGAVMAAAIGGRRTDTTYSRLLESTRAEDVEVEIGGFDNPSIIDSLKRLPQVADLGLESVALGRWTWSLLIDRIGLSAEPGTPGPTLLAGAAWGHAGGQPGRDMAGSGSGPDPASRRPPQRVGG
jgi:hypothetical protein